MRFGAKVAAVEEAKDVAKMTFDDLLGSLQTYEMNLNTQTKDKGNPLKANVNGSDSVPCTENKIMMLTWNFGKLLEKSCKISRTQNFIRGESGDKE